MADGPEHSQHGGKGGCQPTGMGGQISRAWGPWDSGWVLSRVTGSPWSAGTCVEDAAPLSERGEPAGGHEGGDRSGCILEVASEVSHTAGKEQRKGGKVLAWAAGHTEVPFTKMGRWGWDGWINN